MLDLHCHILPGIDDGAPDLATALQMARMAVDDGIHTIICTPHIYPGMYDNDAVGIRTAIQALQRVLDAEGIILRLLEGADVHLQPDLVASIRGGRIPTLAGSRYLLLEPPHHVAPPRFEASVFELTVAGFVPVITHPERLSWLEQNYSMVQRLAHAGVWMQLTSGSLTGRFGRRPKYWSERMLDEGIVHLLATDAHHPQRRPPLLAEGRDAAAARIGDTEARHLVLTRPQGIVDDVAPVELPAVAGMSVAIKTTGFWQRVFGTA